MGLKRAGLGRAGLGWAGGWAWRAGLGCGLGWAGRAKLVHSKMATLCPDQKSERSNGQQQQAMSIYFFLEGLGFRV